MGFNTPIQLGMRAAALLLTGGAGGVVAMPDHEPDATGPTVGASTS